MIDTGRRVSITTPHLRKEAALPTTDPKQNEMTKYISQAWDLAKSQLKQLRAQVEKTAQMAQLKNKSDLIQGERDRALRNLGEAVWREAQRGLKLPPSANAALRAVLEAERKAQKQASEISDILAEGAEAAERLAKKKGH